MDEDLYDYDVILQRMLDRVPNNLDKREGSIIYDALAPAAAELAQIYIVLRNNIDLVFVDTAVDEYLDRLANQIGIERLQATKAIRKGLFYDSNNNLMDIEIGSRFNISNVSYEVIGRISQGTYQLQCETAGEIGNMRIGNLIPIDYIQELAIAELTDILIPGEDMETDEELRARYFETINEKSFAGNRVDYKKNTKEIAGVGAVKVIPVWNGGGTVKLTILDSNFDKASQVLIDKVQDIICPNKDSAGIGLAPIGHLVTVDTVDNLIVNISTTIILKEGLTVNAIKQQIVLELNKYLLELRRNWENEEGLTVRISQIESRILNIEGVLDILNTKLNNGTANAEIDSTKVPVLGEVEFV